MKQLLLLPLVIAATSLLNGCASTDTATTSSAGDPVPGQVKSTEESRLQPGVGTGGTPNATVKW